MSSTSWAVIAAILALMQLIAGVLSFAFPSIFSRRTITYELQAKAPLIHLPVNVNPDLQLMHHGKPMLDPQIVVARLNYRGRKDLESTEFDQKGPLCLDIGVQITALLRSTFVPPKAPVPVVKVNGTTVEIGPSLIRKKLEMEFVILADSPDILLACYGPLANVKIKPRRQAEARRNNYFTVQTILGWLCVAFIVWWVIEQPEGAAHIVHNIGVFFSTVGEGLEHFFASF